MPVEKLSVPFWKYKTAVNASSTKTIINKTNRIALRLLVSIFVLIRREIIRQLADFHKVS